VPFKSRAQQRFAYAHPDKFGGKAGLKEWSQATDFTSLPEKKPMPSHWMQKESEREEKAGTKGSTRRAAHRAGMSTREWSEKHAHSPGKQGQRARMALRYMGAH
jgi:hypothetical protein